jgi:hypothetical protein
MVYIKLLFLSIFFSFSSLSRAEYRVYQYLLTEASQKNTELNKNSHTVVTTLDPQSYASYYPANKNSLTMLRTWMCPGHTGKFKSLCASPYERAEKKWQEDELKENL